MMRVDVLLPELGKDAGDEAKVSFWYKEPGQPVKEGDDLIEMVTDKAAFTVPAPAAGTFVEAAVSEGDTVKVGQKMGVIETEG